MKQFWNNLRKVGERSLVHLFPKDSCGSPHVQLQSGGSGLAQGSTWVLFFMERVLKWPEEMWESYGFMGNKWFAFSWAGWGSTSNLAVFARRIRKQF